MLFVVDVALVALALAGHVACSVVYSNVVHTLRTRRIWITILTRIGQATVVAAIAGFAWWFYEHGFGLTSRPAPGDVPWWMWLYLVAFAPIGAGPLPIWIVGRLRRGHCPQLKTQRRTHHDLVDRLGRHPIAPGLKGLVARLPGNECFELDVSEKEIELPRLPEALDGLSIAHLSDLHLHPGHIEHAYFQEVIDLTNELRADLVVVTGDLIDDRESIPWVAELLSRLESRHGVFVIFGNHDWLVREVPALQAAIEAAGLHYVGGRWHALSIDGHEVHLAGNELPWIRPAAPLADRPRRHAGADLLSIALVHTPDGYAWAREGDFDLMVSGHTHGGQIAFPWLGPIFSAARTGVRYVSGVFYEPPTVLHVSRGLSGREPLRYNCPPEIAKLTLRCPAERRHAAQRTERAAVAAAD